MNGTICTWQRNLEPSLSTGLEIVPVGQVHPISDALKNHTEHMARLVQKVMIESKMLYRDDENFWDLLRQIVPIVYWEPCERAPGGVSLYLLCQALSNYDLASFFSEMIIRWLIPGKQTTLLSTKHLTFRFANLPDETYFISEIFAFVEDDHAFLDIQKNIQDLTHEITLGAVSAHHARHILVTKALTQEHKTTLIHKTIVELSTRKFKPIGPEVFFEMHHFLLASDDEFKRIREVRHMCRIICYHNWFRKLFLSSVGGEQRQVLVKPMRTCLHFQFGEKHVLGIVIAINFLKEYEQFEARHIASACQRLIPNSTVVPRSFFSYQNPSAPINSFYLEIEKRDGSQISSGEISLIRQGLLQEIPHSIEQLSHTLFMPQNEEEIMRNILLLNQEIRYVRDMPQMIITFQGQTDSTLCFHVTLIRIVKDSLTPSLEALFTKASGFVEFISGTRKIIGHVRNKYPKEANTFSLECRKKPFMRLDHAVDLPRAREFIAASIHQALGDVRDFNGGLMSQQNQLLVSIKALLHSDEKKEELHLENLFHSLQPVVMHSLLAPELIKQLFELFLMLHNEKLINNAPRFRELCQDSTLCVMVCAKEGSLFDEMQKEVRKLNFKEQDLGYCRLLDDGLCYFGYILLNAEPEKLVAFQELLQKVLTQFARTKKNVPTLSISLPRPTSLLDPRIGTDRTSGIVIKMLYEGLLRIDPSGKPTPAVATSIKVSLDEKEYTFILRRSKWTNNRPVTAYDFEYAWKKALDPNFKSPFSYLFSPIKNAKLVKMGLLPIEQVGITAKDDYTLVVQLEHPAPYFLELTAHWIYSPLCKEVDQLHPGWAYYGDDTYVCNGPFRLAKWKRNSEIQVLKNDLYWDSEAVHIHQIDISIVEDPRRALALYERGDLDWIGEPLSEIPHEAFKMRNFEGKITSHQIASVHWYECNTKIPPFSSQKCRMALAIALNRKEIIDKLLAGTEKAAYSILPPGLSQNKEPYFRDNNPQLARQLFREGLAELGLNIKDLTQFSITCCDQEIHQSIALMASKQWKEILGLDTRVETMKWDRFMEKYCSHNAHIMATTWYSWAFDPSYNLEHLTELSHQMNTSQWHHPDYSKHFENAQFCLDQDQRLELFHKAENIVMSEIPVIPVFYYTFKYMKKEHLNNIYLSRLGQIDFKWASINSHH